MNEIPVVGPVAAAVNSDAVDTVEPDEPEEPDELEPDEVDVEPDEIDVEEELATLDFVAEVGVEVDDDD